MEDFIYKYFVNPIWDKTGYNSINTLVYAVIAILAVYAIYRILKNKIKIDSSFVRNILCFVLIGSTVRVITDSIDTGVFKGVTPIHQFILDSGIFNYGYFTVTPGIYIVTAVLLFVVMAILYKLKKLDLLGKVGLIIWLPFFLLLVPFMTYGVYAIPILLLAAIPAFIAYRLCFL
ncbi:DUF63 family protein [Candidatus Micrarchaeota archaeon]|nr:DUF63 family protein [Candidatus Micrarchaeota archaeon]